MSKCALFISFFNVVTLKALNPCALSVAFLCYRLTFRGEFASNVLADYELVWFAYTSSFRMSLAPQHLIFSFSKTSLDSFILCLHKKRQFQMSRRCWRFCFCSCRSQKRSQNAINLFVSYYKFFYFAYNVLPFKCFLLLLSTWSYTASGYQMHLELSADLEHPIRYYVMHFIQRN